MITEFLIEITYLSEQQKNQRAKKYIGKIFLLQTQCEQLAETFEHLTNKLEELNGTTKKLDTNFLFSESKI